jgi:tRNA U55 pseudouridine synthase TruB
MQTPPLYSALKRDGRLCTPGPNGETVALTAAVDVYALDLLGLRRARRADRRALLQGFLRPALCTIWDRRTVPRA